MRKVFVAMLILLFAVGVEATEFPADSTLLDTSDTLTTAYAKTVFEALRDAATELPGGAATSELTISSGSVTPTGWLHSIDTESDAASDNLDNILTTNHPDGRMIAIYAESGARTVVVRDEQGGAGQIHLADAASLTMDEADIILVLYRSGSDWYEITRSYGEQADDARSYLGLNNAAVVDTGTADGEVPVMTSTGYPAADGSNITNIEWADYILLWGHLNEDLSYSSADTLSDETWNVRRVDSVIIDETDSVTVSSNQITLDAGTYYINATAVISWDDDSSLYASGAIAHTLKLSETTGNLSDVLGIRQRETWDNNDTSGDAVEGSNTITLQGKFTITDANKTSGYNIWELQHYTNYSTLSGLEVLGIDNGVASTPAPRIFTVIELWRIPN